MITIRTPLLLLLCLSICIPGWLILERIPQDEWLDHRCMALSHGFRPTHAEAHSPPGCMLRSYSASDIRSCLTYRRMSIYGDVEAQQVFLSIAASLDQNHLTNTNLQLHAGFENATILQFELAQIAYQPEATWNSTSYVEHSGLYVLLNATSFKQEYPFGNDSAMFMGSSFAFSEDDLRSPSARAQVVLNYFCNGLLEAAQGQTQAYCCAGYVPPNTVQKLLLLAGSCAILLHLFLWLLRQKLCGLSDNNLQSVPETRRVVAAVATTSAAVMTCFVADRTALFEKASKTVDLTTFILLTSVAFLAGILTCRHCQLPNALIVSKGSAQGDHCCLSRQQTEEWKGWMQIVILLYHYFGMSKILWVYQFVRLLVSSYLFMSGFGHATYFVTTNDFSYRRCASVLLRTNLLNIILAFVLGTRYDLYYFPMLTSIWFLLVWITIPRTPESGVDVYCCTRRITLSVVVLRLALERRASIESLLNSLGGMRLGLPEIDGREFLFRFGLDAYIVYVGMVTAVLSAWLKGRKSLPHHSLSWPPFPCPRLRSAVVVSAAALGIPAYACFCHAFQDKIQYNKWHPFVSPLPVISFIILRNSTCRLSNHYSRLFAWFGRCSLETFVLQYHLWLAADSRGVLRTGLFSNLSRSVHSRYMLGVLDTAFIFTTFVVISCSTSKALSVLTRVLVDLQAKILLVIIGLWITNLAWSFSILGRHAYSY